MLYANPKVVGAQLLKILGDLQSQSFNELQSRTGLPADVLERGLAELTESGLIFGDQSKYSLTERGDKARYFVST